MLILTENYWQQSAVLITSYSGCQKNVPLSERFFLQPLIPSFRISELIFEKWYNSYLLIQPTHSEFTLLHA
jgi:hypothetical protein